MAAVPLFLMLFFLSALPGWDLLRRMDVETGSAWALGRVLGPILVVFPAWWAASIGIPHWPLLAGALLAVATVCAAPRLHRELPWRSIGPHEALFWTASTIILFLRAPRPAILHTEKFMDMGILSSLMRSSVFPPEDFWLAGRSLPYYYWEPYPGPPDSELPDSRWTSATTSSSPCSAA